jgi:DUF438 domain-containing protein
MPYSIAKKNRGTKMDPSNPQNTALYKNILDHMKIRVTCVDAEGNILYANPAAKKRPSKAPREPGVNIRECHREKSNENIAAIFSDFKNGRSEPHHYISSAQGKKELVTIIPMFEEGVFKGCMSHIHPLTFDGPERSF